MDKKLVLFLNAIGISNKNIKKIGKEFSSILELKENSKRLEEIDELDKRTASKIYKKIDFNLDEYIEKLKKENIKLTFFGDQNYPENLKLIEDSPIMLYYKGYLSSGDSLGISIVGARKCTSYGAWACEKIVNELCHYNIPIISGMASGIDTISHEISLKNENKTVAVLGSGIDVIYPKTNHKLYDNLVENGAVISEFPIGTKPYPYNFPYRNRIISGIGQGVLVIEAKEKSGTLITANYGAEQGKEVFAIPGNINSIYSKGTNLLIKDGAKIVTSTEDILEEITYKKTDKSKENVKLDGVSKLIYDEISKEPKSSDELSIILNMKIEEISVILTILELNGYIIETKGGKFTPD